MRLFTTTSSPRRQIASSKKLQASNPIWSRLSLRSASRNVQKPIYNSMQHLLTQTSGQWPRTTTRGGTKREIQAAGDAGWAKCRVVPLPYPNIVNTSHATERVANIFRSFFTAKSEHNATELMEHFSRCCAYYIDATSVGLWPSWDALNTLFQSFLPTRPPTALSYPWRIIG